MWWNSAQLIVGLLVLVVGADLLVRGASALSARMGLSKLVIGLTVVSLGTSSPEIVVSVLAALKGKTDLTLGNVVGSNIFNVLFILGLAAVITPLAVSRRLVRIDVPIMIGVSILVWIFGLNGHLGQLEGLVLLAAMVAYTAASYFIARRDPEAEKGLKVPGLETSDARPSSSRTQVWRSVAFLATGLAALVFGSEVMVSAATMIAKVFGLSDLIIGLTVVAVGTSLPELATSVLAAIKGERDIAVGNAVGSNIMNLLAVLGLACVINPGGVPVSPVAQSFDLPVMVAVAMACLPVFFTGRVIARWEGALFLLYYIAYTSYLFLKTSHHDSLGAFEWIVVAFALPLTALTLIACSIRSAARNLKT